MVDRMMWAYALAVVLLTVCAWLAYWHSGKDPMMRPLFERLDRGTDLTAYTVKIANLRLGAAELGTGLPVFNYLAPAAYVYRLLLGLFPSQPLEAYAVLVGLAMGAFAAVLCRSVQVGGKWIWSAATAIGATACFGFPVWFAVDRGNIEGVVWALSATGLCLLLRERWMWAAIAFGAAASIKPFPALFFLLLLAQRRYKETAAGVLTSAVLVLVALIGLGPNPVRAYRNLTVGVNVYLEHYVDHFLRPTEARFNHSLLDGIKSLDVVKRADSLHPKAVEQRQRELEASGASSMRAARLYVPVVSAALLILCGVFYSKPVLNQMIAACAAVALLPLSAAEYTLLYLYVPAGYFLVFLARDVRSGRVQLAPRVVAVFLLLFAFLLTPLTELRVFAGDAQLILLVALVAMAARYPLRTAHDGAQSAADSRIGQLRQSSAA